MHITPRSHPLFQSFEAGPDFHPIQPIFALAERTRWRSSMAHSLAGRDLKQTASDRFNNTLSEGGHFSRAIGQAVPNLARWHWPSDMPEPPK